MQARQVLRRRGRPAAGQERIAIWLLIGILALSVLYPVAILVRQSFTVARDDPTPTLEWYRLLATPQYRSIIATTLFLVATSGVLAVIVGMALAWFVERVEIPFRGLAGLVPIFPLLVPSVMGAAAWAFLLSPQAGYGNVALRAIFGLEGRGPINIFSMWGIVFVITLYIVPFSYSVFYPAFRSMDGAMEEAAYVFGAGELTTARTVTFGLVRPAMFGAMLLSFVLAMAHFTIPYILGFGRVPVLTTEIYTHMRDTFPANAGAATAIAMITLIPSLVFLGMQHRLLRKGSFAVVGGKGGRGRRITSRGVRWLAGTALGGYAVLAFVLPMASIAMVSFSRFWNGRIDREILTTDNYTFILQTYAATWPAIRTSVLLGLLGATVSVLLAFVVAYLSLRSRARSARFLDQIGTIPAGVPSICLGLGFLLAFIRPPIVLYGTVWLLLIAYLVIFIPYAIRPVSAAIRQVAPELEDAARMSGSSWSAALRQVTLPLVFVSLLAAWALLFVMLSREVAASVFLVAAGVKLIGPTIFDLWSNGRPQHLAAFSMVVIIGSAVFIGVAQALTRERAFGQPGLLTRAYRAALTPRRPGADGAATAPAEAPPTGADGAEPTPTSLQR